MKGRFLVDTNVLVYATLTNDYRNKEALAVLELRHRWSNQLFISAQNLAEMYPVLTGPKTQPSDSPALAREKITAFAMMNSCNVIPVTSQVVLKALELCEKYNTRSRDFFTCNL